MLKLLGVLLILSPMAMAQNRTTPTTTTTPVTTGSAWDKIGIDLGLTVTGTGTSAGTYKMSHLKRADSRFYHYDRVIITFPTGKYVLPQQVKDKLKEIGSSFKTAFTSTTCDKLPTVFGHASSKGNSTGYDNTTLSENRMKAVSDALKVGSGDVSKVEKKGQGTAFLVDSTFELISESKKEEDADASQRVEIIIPAKDFLTLNLKFVFPYLSADIKVFEEYNKAQIEKFKFDMDSKCKSNVSSLEFIGYLGADSAAKVTSSTNILNNILGKSKTICQGLDQQTTKFRIIGLKTFSQSEISAYIGPGPSTQRQESNYGYFLQNTDLSSSSNSPGWKQENGQTTLCSPAEWVPYASLTPEEKELYKLNEKGTMDVIGLSKARATAAMKYFKAQLPEYTDKVGAVSGKGYDTLGTIVQVKVKLK